MYFQLLLCYYLYSCVGAIYRYYESRRRIINDWHPKRSAQVERNLTVTRNLMDGSPYYSRHNRIIAPIYKRDGNRIVSSVFLCEEMYGKA